MDYFGICDGPMNRGDDYLKQCDEIIATGIKWVRMGPSWNRIEKSKGVYDQDYLARCDAVVNRLTANGVNILWILSYTAPWASSSATRPTFHKPANWADWEDFVQFVCTRYKGKITHWEIWNEQDHPSKTFWEDTPADYTVLLQKASAKARAVDSENKILIGGFTGAGAAYLNTLFEEDPALGSYFDIMAYHVYVDSPNMVARYEQFIAVMEQRNIADKPIWITETGYTTNGESSLEVTKADWVDQARVTQFSLPGIQKIFWYDYRCPEPYGDIAMEHFGLELADRTPLKAYYHYQGGDCAETNFALQKAYPTEAAQRLTLTFVDDAGGKAGIEDYADDGSSKLIPAGHYMVCRINDHYIYGNNHGLDSTVTLEVTYWDEGTHDWQLQYQTATTTVQTLTGSRTNTLEWKTQKFTITDHDFKNGQSWGGDFRIFAGTYDALAVSRVAVCREMNPARVILGYTNYNKLMEQVIDTNPSNNAYSIPWTIGGRECRKIENGSKYLYFKVCDGVVRTGDTNVTVGVLYYDAGSDNIVLQYQSTTSDGDTVNAQPIVKTNTNTWKYGTFHLTDAQFDNSRSWKSDFRIYSGADGSPEYIAMVDVRRKDDGDNEPEPPEPPPPGPGDNSDSSGGGGGAVSIWFFLTAAALAIFRRR
ncbi:glycosyl hydrolase [Ereboglobus luteus]|nr:glycosyl hydrolase [Ereboglobus luteus]